MLSRTSGSSSTTRINELATSRSTNDLTVGLPGHKLLASSARYDDAEDRSLADLRPQLEGMIQQFDQAFDDRQSEAEPFSAVSLRIFELTKLLKYLPMLVFRNSASGIPHFDSHCVSASARTENDASAICVANCVGNKVSHDAFKQDGIATHKQ